MNSSSIVVSEHDISHVTDKQLQRTDLCPEFPEPALYCQYLIPLRKQQRAHTQIIYLFRVVELTTH